MTNRWLSGGGQAFLKLLLTRVRNSSPDSGSKIQYRTIVAADDPAALRAHARARGWNRLRFSSAGDRTFKYDLGSEDREGKQDSTISVFNRDSHGAVHHFYMAYPWMSPEIKKRGIDLMSPTWHVLDLTPQGRGDWYAKLAYPMRSHA
jgi:predicted dithiol-disulfide oxidoreductase (DUF899 family)